MTCLNSFHFGARLVAALVVACTASIVMNPLHIEAAALALRVSDRLDGNAQAVAVFPLGTSNIVANVNYRDVNQGSSVDLAIFDRNNLQVAAYREPIWMTGSGAFQSRLIAPTALAPGEYRVRAQVAGGESVEQRFSVGSPVESAPPTPVSTPVVSPEPSPGPVRPVPVQLASARAPAGSTHESLLSQVVAPSSGSTALRTVADRRFGLANIFPNGAAVPGVAASGSVAWMTRAKQVGAVDNRWEIRWDSIETAPGVFNWAATDLAVSATRGAGLRLVAVVVGTPGWAGTSAASPPRGLDQSPILSDGTMNPANPWGRFMRTLANRYSGQIDAYEIWNEPNRPDFWGGTADDYYRLLSTAMAAIRHADANAKVVFGGLDGFRDLTFLDAVLSAAVADPRPPGRRGAFDVLAWHAYHRPADLYVGTIALRERLARRGLSQPIWITETNTAAWDDVHVRGANSQPYRWSATGDEQAAFVIQALSYAIAGDVERVIFYRASDTGEREAWGLLNADGAPRKVETAFQFASNLLSGASSATLVREKGADRVVVDQPDRRVTIAWALGPVDAVVRVPAINGLGAEMRDKVGGVGPLIAVDGAYDIQLAAASANLGTSASDFLIGGEPLVIVEKKS